jgi:hypothetical protein
LKRSISVRARQLLALAALSVGLVGGAAQLGRWSTPERKQVDRRMAYWQTVLVDLERSAEEEQSFRSAYKLLCHTISMVDTIQILRSVGAQVELKPELRLQLESAHLIASARARSDRELKRVRDLEARYQQALRSLQPPGGVEVRQPEVTAAESYRLNGSSPG